MMAGLYGNQADVDRLLLESQLWFVVGLGNNPDRDAYGVAAVLQEHGKRIIPIYPRAEVVHGEQGYATIADAVAAVGIPDVVDVFVRSISSLASFSCWILDAFSKADALAAIAA